jgi:ATP-dependent helicase HrpA
VAVARVTARLEDVTREVLAEVVRVLTAWRDTDRVLSGSADLATLPALTDMKAQLARLVHRGFVADTGLAQLRQLPRYLSAVRLRRERLSAAVDRDRILMSQVMPLQDAYLHRVAALRERQAPPGGLVQVGWMLEEYRVSLWAQQLGTAYAVSDARIRKALDAL